MGIAIALLLVALLAAGYLFGTVPGRAWRLRRASTSDLLARTLSHPEDAQAQRVLAERLLAENRPDEAASAFDAWARAHPNAVAPLVGLGRALLRANRPADALAPLDEAARRAPNNSDALAALGEAHYALGNTEAARRHLQATLERRPDHADTWANLAFVLSDLRQHDESRAAGQKATQLAPASSRAHTALGYARDAVGDTAGAITALEQATRLDVANGRAWSLLAGARTRAARTEADFAAAHTALDRAAALLPNSPRVPYCRGLLLLAQRRYGDSVQAFGEALKRDANFTDALYNQSIALAFAGRSTESTRAHARFERARAYDRETIHLQLRIGREPANVALWRHLLTLAETHGDQEKARLARLRLRVLAGTDGSAPEPSRAGPG